MQNFSEKITDAIVTGTVAWLTKYSGAACCRVAAEYYEYNNPTKALQSVPAASLSQFMLTRIKSTAVKMS